MKRRAGISCIFGVVCLSRRRLCHVHELCFGVLPRSNFVRHCALVYRCKSSNRRLNKQPADHTSNNAKERHKMPDLKRRRRSRDGRNGKGMWGCAAASLGFVSDVCYCCCCGCSGGSMAKMKDCPRLFDAFVSSFFWALNYFVGGSEEFRLPR